MKIKSINIAKYISIAIAVVFLQIGYLNAANDMSDNKNIIFIPQLDDMVKKELMQLEKDQRSLYSRIERSKKKSVAYRISKNASGIRKAGSYYVYVC